MMWGYGSDWGMRPWGNWGYGGPIGMIIGIVILALAVAAVAWFVRTRNYTGQQLAGTGRQSPGLDVLEERYARGEIKREEYLEKKQDLSG
jgi:putative membrane protein